MESALLKAGATNKELRDELEQLAEFIASAKSDIASLVPDDVKSEYLPVASGELDAIIDATEQATHEIMTAAEGIDDLADGLDGKVKSKLTDLTVRIYTACGFQDVTGQRISKVVSTLKHIEDRVDALIDAFGTTSKKGSKKKVPKKSAKKSRASDKKVSSDEGLLNGPQLKGNAIKQEDIDAILAGLD
ncbi:MAG: protein phosphatase CheZ [Rhodospirillales bacterium]|nr:protein phosphatase CheZ [Rhodospirillales bacterium]